MFYRENGQYKTSYAADAAIFPIWQDKIAIGLLLLFAFAGVPLLAIMGVGPFGHDYIFKALLIPFLDPGAGGDRAQYSGRLLRPNLPRRRRVHGRRRLFGLQFRAANSGTAVADFDPARRRCRGPGRDPVRNSKPAHQGALSRGRHACSAVLFRLAIPAREMVHELYAVRLGERAES